MRSSTGADRSANSSLRLVLTSPPPTRSTRAIAAPGKIGSSKRATAARSSSSSGRSRSQVCLMLSGAGRRSVAAASKRGRMRHAAHTRAPEHGQFPAAVHIVYAQDVDRAVVAHDLDVAVIGPEPLVDGLDDAD